MFKNSLNSFTDVMKIVDIADFILKSETTPVREFHKVLILSRCSFRFFGKFLDLMKCNKNVGLNAEFLPHFLNFRNLTKIGTCICKSAVGRI